MKICYICSEYPPAPHGGIGSVVRVLGRALAARGHEVKVIGMYSGAVEAPAYEMDQGVEVWRLRRTEPGLSWVGDRYQIYRRVAEWARQGAIDLVEAPDWEGWVAGWPKLPVPVIVRLHGSICYFAAELGTSFKKTNYWLESAALRRSDYWCSVSEYTAAKTRDLFGLAHGPDAVIYNGVVLPVPAPQAPRSRTDVVFSGTLTAKKGIISLIESWPAVQAKCPQARLHVYGKDTTKPGEPSMREFLTEQIPERLRPTVHFHGHAARETLLAHLQQAAVAVFPSYAEAFAMAPIEAMAQGCPTIYSVRGSGPELIADGEDGLLVDPAQPAEIAHAMVRILTNDAFAERLGQAGQEKIKTAFSIERVLRTNEDFYGSCVERFAHASRN